MNYLNASLKTDRPSGASLHNAAAAVALLAAAIAPNAMADAEDIAIGAGAGAAVTATIASVAAPAAIAHSSGAAILYSGAGYVAGTMGAAATTVALLPFIAVGGAAIATGALAYKYRCELGISCDQEEGQ